MIVLIQSCGDNKKGERCRGAEEMQMLCQVEWAEEFETFTIPDWVKNQCTNFYRVQVATMTHQSGITGN